MSEQRITTLVEEHERARAAAGGARRGISDLASEPAGVPDPRPLPSRIGSLGEWARAQRDREEAEATKAEVERLAASAAEGHWSTLVRAEATMARVVDDLLKEGMPPEVWVRVGDRGAILTEEFFMRREMDLHFWSLAPSVPEGVAGLDAPVRCCLGIGARPMPLALVARRFDVGEEELLRKVKSAAEDISGLEGKPSTELIRFAEQMARRRAVVEPERLDLVLVPWEAVELADEDASPFLVSGRLARAALAARRVPVPALRPAAARSVLLADDYGPEAAFFGSTFAVGAALTFGLLLLGGSAFVPAIGVGLVVGVLACTLTATSVLGGP